MKSQITPIETATGNVSILTGVQWMDTADNDSVKQFIKREEIADPVIINITVHAHAAQKGVASLKGVKAKTLYPAARMFAFMQTAADLYFENTNAAKADSWVVVEKLGSKYWLCLISDGLVVKEFDHLLDAEEARDEADKLGTYAQSQNQTCEFVGSGITEFIGTAEVVSLEIIFSKLTSEELASLKVSKDKAQAIKVGLLVLLVASFGAYEFGPQLGLISNEPSPEELRAQQEQAAITLLQSHYQTYFNKPSVNYAVLTVFNQVENRQLFDAPWSLHRLNCDLDTQQCQATYKNPTNVRVRFIEEYLDSRCDSVSTTAQGAASNCSFQLDYSKIEQPEHEAGDNVHELTNYLMSYADVGLATEISTPTPASIPNTEAAPVQYRRNDGAWKISGSYIDAVNLAQHVPNVLWAKPRTLVITQNSEATDLALVIEGSYVIK